MALRVKVLQIKSECSQFKPNYTLSYLAAPQATLSHYQTGSPTTSMLITVLSTVLTQRSPGDLQGPDLAMRFPFTSGQSCFNAEINIELFRLTPR